MYLIVFSFVGKRLYLPISLERLKMCDEQVLRELIDNRLVTLDLTSNREIASFHSLNTGDYVTNKEAITSEGASKLSEVLKLNTSLTRLILKGKSAHFAHLLLQFILTEYKIIKLVLKELPNWLKHSN
jgi:hypothetical protein